MPTSIGLIIYGLIVMFQADVAQAFRMVEEGYAVEQVREELTRPGYGRRYADDDRRRSRGASDEDDEDRSRPKHQEDRRPPPKQGPAGDDDHFYEK